MKNKLRIPIIALSVVIVLAIVFYFAPKTFGRNVNPSDVDHINVFDGYTGVGFTIENPEDIQYIVENVQNQSMKRDGISLGRMGYLFSISYIDSNGKDIIPIFFINSDDTIRKEPFFYRCEGQLCVEYLKELESKSENAFTTLTHGPESATGHSQNK